jgi:uncharacterized membrane protein
LNLSNLQEYARSRLWVMPTLFLIATLILSRVVLAIDSAIGLEDAADERATRWYAFPGGPEGAREILSTVAASTFTFAGVVFSITIVVLQLASNRMSPRVMRMFLRDVGTQVVLATLLATFLYSLLILREVQSTDVVNVPAFAIWIAFLLMIINIGLFVFYINHMTQRIRPSTILAMIGSETRGAIDRVHPHDFGEEEERPFQPPARQPHIVFNDNRNGVVTYIDRSSLAETAKNCGYMVQVVPTPGDFVARQAPLMKVWTVNEHEGEEIDEQALRKTVSLLRERTLQQDAAFGIRQLVDIAERALSPSTNDPTTAVQAVDQIHDLLRQLGRKATPGAYVDPDGRIMINQPHWEDYVRLSLDEIRSYGKTSMQILKRLRFVLEDLTDAAVPQRRAVLREQMTLLDEAIERSIESDRDREIVRVASAQGYGPASESPMRSGNTGR